MLAQRIQLVDTPIIRNGLICLYPMSESSGTTLNERYNSGRNATLTNGPTWNNTASDGPCVSFDGTNDYANASFSGLTAKPFTVVFKVKLTKTTGGRTLFVLGSADGVNRHGIMLSVQWDLNRYTIAHRYGATDAYINIDSSTGIVDRWSVFGVSVAVGSNSSILRINDLKQTGTLTSDMPPIDRLTIATNFNKFGTIVGEHPTMLSKDFRIYNRVLSDSEFYHITNGHG